ncbi:hypothetical protein [Paenibacillus ehimensis]|uniref:NEAT domain-containing protein n=1 Tax=Paenibacillus ehimensis TaxID=79264 RepID=A0ABT8VM80_9BACL|nr:hypothetical protein [Paenibacillus ehimensis]MDO3682090.1 hypothetical protein [Paenibacillus ehimensis]
MKKFVSILLGVVLLLALPSFTSAAAIPEFGPQAYEVKKYYYWGDSNFGEKVRQGLDLSVDPSSISYQSVKATLTMDYNIIMDRKITKFVVLANGVKVDEVEPYFDRSLNPPVFKEFYYLDINVSDQYIGSDVYFQILGLRQDGALGSSSVNEFVVAWSQETPTFRLKPLPVTDSDTHGLINESNILLDKILAKLEQLRMDMMMKLDQVQKAVEDIYTVKPQTQQKFDAALNNFKNMLPPEQIKREMQQVKDMLDDSAKQIEGTKQELKFGQITWMGAVTTPAIDLTEVADQVEKLRNILKIALWCEFFYCVILILRPRFTV